MFDFSAWFVVVDQLFVCYSRLQFQFDCTLLTLTCLDKMSRKGKYFLLMFSNDPPAADTIRSDALVRSGDAILRDGDEATYILEMAKDRLEEVRGVVVATGMWA